MAVFFYDRTKTFEIQDALDAAPDDIDVYFSPSACGMIQIITPEDVANKNTPAKFRRDIKCSARRGHEKLRDQTYTLNDTLKMNDTFIDKIRQCSTFRMLVHLKKDHISYKLKGNRRKGNTP